ncbi:MAG: amino acid ABC transporter ATP-binding protein [Clostridia bacterium]|nr:amino acid ABC transporter ATP-binding protein [Clostridia bacterium]
MSILEVKDLYKNFGKTQVLRGISFSMQQGEVLSVIGSSGSGKTTLLRCLTSLERADGGSITVGGKVVFDPAAGVNLSKEEARANQLQFGMVFQQFNLFPQYSVLDNVTLASRLHAKERADYRENKKEILAQIEEHAKELLDRVGLLQKAENYPCQLSGGQQQRVAIARALAMKPAILCFDEPTSALDPELTGEVLSVIRSLAAQKTTMIIVTHEMGFARDVSDTVLFMEEGRVAVKGAPDYVFGEGATPRMRSFIGAVTNYG